MNAISINIALDKTSLRQIKQSKNANKRYIRKFVLNSPLSQFIFWLASIALTPAVATHAILPVSHYPFPHLSPRINHDTTVVRHPEFGVENTLIVAHPPYYILLGLI